MGEVIIVKENDIQRIKFNGNKKYQKRAFISDETNALFSNNNKSLFCLFK
jgi:hypothetical protein